MCKRTYWILLSVLLSLTLFRELLPLVSIADGGSAPLTTYDVVINEWSQGNGSGNTEWVELLVARGPLDLRGWDLGDSSAGDLAFADASLWSHVPAGTLIVVYNRDARDTLLPADDTDLSDCVVVIPDNSIFFFSGDLPTFNDDDPWDNPHLRDSSGVSVHDYSVDPGPTVHPAALQSARYEGSSAAEIGDAGQWITASASTATPGTGNSLENAAWIDALCLGGEREPDLVLSMDGPDAAVPGSTLAYTIGVSNVGNVTATAVVLTDTLPAGVTYVTDDSPYPHNEVNSHTHNWNLGSILPDQQTGFMITATLGAPVSGPLVNRAAVSTKINENQLANNIAAVTMTVVVTETPQVLIDAVLYDGYELNHLDEAILLRNVTGSLVDIGGWRLNDGESSAVTFPPNTLLGAGQTIWLAKEAAAFQRQFGFLPQFEALDSRPMAVPTLIGSWPQLADSGDQVILFDQSDHIVDCLVYELGNTNDCGGEWQGAAVQPYRAANEFAEEGQLLYRRRDQRTGLPVADTNGGNDWAQGSDDPLNGRRVRYPGWDLDRFFFTSQVTETAVLTIAVAPDNAFRAVVNEIRAARTSIEIESLTFENLAVADALIEAAQRGVTVSVLLEGSPPTGLPDQEKYICQQLEAAGGECWFMINDASQKIFDRYRFLHAKFLVIDGRRTIIGSENLSPRSLPDDDKSDGTWGHRGIILITDASGVSNAAHRLFALDLGCGSHQDIVRWKSDDTEYGPPPSGFLPITVTGGISYEVRYASPVALTGTFAFEIQQAPENSLRDVDGLLGLVGQAGAGDTILVQQLAERPHWGDSTSTPAEDPNLRLEAYLNAARQGARVRLLLDAFFSRSSDPLSNEATCVYVREVAQRESLPIECALGNPTGLGIHSKMVLAWVNGRGYVHVGSLNGTELSNKGNRELALQVQSDAAYEFLEEVFRHDWPNAVFMPVIFQEYRGPAGHLLISEFLYDPPGPDDAEFIELVNPTGKIIDLNGYSVGDAVNRNDFEDVRRFPAGTTLASRGTLVVATSGDAFFAEYGFYPDFEILNTMPQVPDLIDDKSWGDPAALLQLGNLGDEILLRDPSDRPVDVVTYGNGQFPGVVACPLVTTANSSLERQPYWRDTDVCPADFREWPFPNPGALP